MLQVESDAPSAATIKKDITPLNMNQNHCRNFKTCTGAENIPENCMTSGCADGLRKSSDPEKIKLNKKNCEKDIEKNENYDARKSLSTSPVLNGRRKVRTSILFPVLREAGSPIISPLGSVKGRGSTSRRMTLSPATARSLILEVMEEEKEKEGEKVKGEREGVKGKGMNIDDVKEEVREKEEAMLTRDLPVNGTTSPHTHLPIVQPSPLPLSLSTLTSNSPLVMPLYPPLNSPPANFPLVIMNSKHENEKTIFEERNSTPSKKEIAKTKSGKMSNETAILNFRILADQKEKAVFLNEEKERNASLLASDKIFDQVEGNKLPTTSEKIAHTVIVSDRSPENNSTRTVTNSVQQSPVERSFLRHEERCVEKDSEENDSRKIESSIEVLNEDSDEHENESDNENKNENEESEDSVIEEMNVEELIVLTEIKEIKNLAYHEELNALLDSDSDVSTAVSPVRPAYPATANPVDCFSGISPGDLELANELNSSPILVRSTDTKISRTVIPLQSTRSPGRFHEMTYSSESTEDSFHAFLSLSENLNNETENEIDVVMDELDGKTILLNNSLIADNQSSPTTNQTKNNNNNDEEMLEISPTITQEEIDNPRIHMDIPTEEEETIITNDTAVLVRKRTEEYSERNEIVKKSKMEKFKTSRRCISLTTRESVKNVPGEGSADHSLCLSNVTCFLSKKSEKDFLDTDAQNAKISALNDVAAATATATTNNAATNAANTVDCDRELHKQSMDTSNNTNITSNNTNSITHNNTNNNTNEVVVEVTLDNAKDRAMGRMSIRNEIAKWKYGWEIASFCAAQAARQKLSLLSPL